MNRTRKHGGKTKHTRKDRPLCQCMNANTGKGCAKGTTPNSVFCKDHQSCPLSPLSGSEPEYAPETYNHDPAIYKSHNCYSYSMNVIDPQLVKQCERKEKMGKLNTCRQSFHQPGALHGDRFTLNAESRRTCPVVEKLMKSDVPEIQTSSFSQRCPKGMSKIALVVDKGEDYHFYRQDKDKAWSHKDGSNKVKRYDANKQKIVNPQLASRDYRPQGSDLNYEDFCGFYCVPRVQQVQLGQGGARKRTLSRKKAGGSRKVLGGSWTDHPSR